MDAKRGLKHFFPWYYFFGGWLVVQKNCNWAFTAFDMFGHALAKDLFELLSKYDSRKKIIVYVKDKRSNLNIMTIALKSIVNYDVLGLTKKN